MSGTSARARNVEAQKPADLQPQIDQLALQIEQLSSSKARADIRQSELASERQTLVIAARWEKETAAQERIRQIDEEAGRVAHDIADDGVAITELSAQLAEMRRAQTATEWENSRAEVRELILKRSDQIKKGDLQRTIDAVLKELDEGAQADGELWRALLRFDFSLKNEAGRIGKLARHRGEMAALALEKHLPVNLVGFPRARMRNHTFSDIDLQVLSDALEALNRLELVL